MNSNLKNIALDEIEQKLETDGYVVIDNFLTQEQIDRLKKAYYTNIPEDLSKLHMSYTMASSDLAYRKKVSFCIKDIFQKQIEFLFPEHRISYGMFFWKKPETQYNQFKIHQHSSPIKESKFKTVYNVWCPLIDVNKNNGCLQFIKGSHKLNRFTVLTMDIPQNYVRTMKKYLINVPMKAGQALIFNNNVLHGSFANKSKRERIGTFATLIPSDAQLYYYQADNPVSPTQYEIFEVDDNFSSEVIYLPQDGKVKLPQDKKIKSVDVMIHNIPSFSKREILKILDRNTSKNNSLFTQNMKITFDIFILNLEEQLSNLKATIKNFLPN